tara:strand:- start:145 stop:303 length:159 start_codon:yes stop_codon:yes gene_type:complete
VKFFAHLWPDKINEIFTNIPKNKAKIISTRKVVVGIKYDMYVSTFFIFITEY